MSRITFTEALTAFEKALFETRWIAERVIAGEQFNCYELCQSDDDDDDDDLEGRDREYALSLGPITSCRFILTIEGKDKADLIEAALKVATEAFRANFAAGALEGTPA